MECLPNMLKIIGNQSKTNNMETTATEITTIKSATEARFEIIKKEALQIALQCKSAKVTDEITLGMASQIASKANQLSKAIDAKREEIKKPYLEAGRTIDTIAKSVLTPLSEGIEAIKKELRAWNEKQAEIARQQEIENTKISAKLQAINSQLTVKVNNCKNPQSCQDLIDSIGVNFPALETFGKYAEQAKEMKDRYIQLLRLRKATTEASNVLEQNKIANDTHNTIVSIEANAMTISTKQEIIAESITPTKSKTRKTWKFEVVDEVVLPREFCSADEVKIRKYMNDNKDTFGNEKIVAGVRFFLDESPII